MTKKMKSWLWFIGLYLGGLVSVLILAGIVKLIIYFFG